jgi:colanic acid/amylovoran biosynthesis protein
MKILITNVHSADNAGDLALFLESIQQLKVAFGAKVEIALTIDDPTSLSIEYEKAQSLFGWLLQNRPDGNAKLNPLRLIFAPFFTLLPLLIYRFMHRIPLFFTPAALRPLLLAYSKANLIASVAGGFLYSSGRGTVLLIHFYDLFLAWVAGKPFYLLPQSIGPFRRRWECIVARYVLSKARLILVRDPISQEQLAKCGFSHPVPVLTYDLGFSFEAAEESVLENWLAEHQLSLPAHWPLLGITTINWGAQFSGFQRQELYESALVEAAKEFINLTAGKVIFFPQVCGPLPIQDDRIPSRRIISQLDDYAGSATLFSEPAPPAILKAMYRKTTIFLGTRMHSNIFALGNGVPVLAIGYLHKTQGIMQMLGLSDWVIDIREAEPGNVVPRLQQLWEKRDQVAQQIASQLPEVHRENLQTAQLIAADFKKNLK